MEVKDAADKRVRREKEWSGIIIHTTDVGGRKEISRSLWKQLSVNITEWLTRKDDVYVSAHYTIHRDGKVVQLVNPDTFEAFHAGVSLFWHPKKRTVVSDWNRYAIGIELIGDCNIHPLSNEQYDSLHELVRMLMRKYKTIHPQCITSHEVIAPGRKYDPGPLFDWARFYRGVFG